MSHTSSTSIHEQFWLSCKLSSVLKDNFDLDRTVEGETELTERTRRDENDKLQLTTDYANFLTAGSGHVTEKNFVNLHDLNFWAVYRSWTFCKECGSFDRVKLLPSFQSKTAVRCKTTCHCKDI